MFRRIIYIWSVIVFGGLTSCTEIIDIELDSTYTRLVLHGTITTDFRSHAVSLSTTTDYFYNEAPPILENAEVRLLVGDSTIVYTESQLQPGTYLPPFAFRGIPGTTYLVEISNVDVDGDGETEFYTASSTMPRILPPDSLQIQKFISPFFSGYQIALWAPDPTGANWYNFKLYRNGELLNKRLSSYTVQPDEFFADNYISGVPVGFLDDDEEDEFVVPGDTVMLELNSITKEYYEFIVDAQSEIFGNNPLFSGPPANVRSNLSEGAKGVFAAYSIERIEKTVPLPDLN